MSLRWSLLVCQSCAEPARRGVVLAGNKVEAYGGSISFTLGHSEYNSLGLGAQEDYDLIIESKTLGITLGHKHIVPGGLYPVSPPARHAHTYERAYRTHPQYEKAGLESSREERSLAFSRAPA